MLSEKQSKVLRSLPAVNYILQLPEINELIGLSDFELISDLASKVIESERKNILNSDDPSEITISNIIEKITVQYKKLTKPRLHSVINGTGVVLHTNLGRAKLSNESLAAVQDAAALYSNLEFNIEQGIRGSRYEHVEDLLKQLTGAEAAMVVNNNAAAVILILKEMAEIKEVIVSRGQLVEIGGSFRVSEIMHQSGAKLVEVGTTNKTHSYDYEKAITDNTGLLMKVHTSNYKMIGFTKEVCLKTLVEIGKENQIPVYEDLGSGVLYDLRQHGVGNEPTVQETVKAGADLVSFSGDKLLGGPQAGIIVGKKKYIDRIKKNQLTRALRVDKMTLAALEATLRHYLLNEAVEKIPTLNMILMELKTIEANANKLYDLLKPLFPESKDIKIIDGYSEVGGGSLPDVQLPTKLIAISPAFMPAHKLERELRTNEPNIIGRIYDEQFLLDVRTIEIEEYPLIKEKLERIIIEKVRRKA